MIPQHPYSQIGSDRPTRLQPDEHPLDIRYWFRIAHREGKKCPALLIKIQSIFRMMLYYTT
jgi:hypothetical protein